MEETPRQQAPMQAVDQTMIASSSNTSMFNEHYEDPLLDDQHLILSETIIVNHFHADRFTHMVISILDTLLTNNINLDLTNTNECATSLIEFRQHFLYALESSIYSRMPRTSFKLYSHCDEIIKIDIKNKSLMDLVEAEDEFKIANFYCRVGIFLSATNYLLEEIIKNDDIIKAINGTTKGVEFKRKEFSQRFNNSKNHLTPIIKEMRKILLEDENLKFKDLKVEINIKALKTCKN
uniref:GLTP domain-containing protein n=1 Tax=Meloidogyne hapla TaxID=6305 RepID=A0A1I8BDQ7_MELHA